jgi:alanine racemase
VTHTSALIDTDAVQQNLLAVRALTPRAKICAVVKDNAYGHGVEIISSAISAEVDAFSVATIEEGSQLRGIGVELPIWVFSGFLDSRELSQISQFDLTPVIHSAYQLQLIEKSKLRIPIIVEIDTGMGRLGVRYDESDDFLARANNVANLTVILSHFSESDLQSSDHTSMQMEKFENVAIGLDVPRSIANSAAIISGCYDVVDWVRPGLMLYGVSPFANSTGADHGLRASMTLESRLIAIRKMRKGDSIGYYSTWCCPEEMPIGIVSCGYGDGYPRSICEGTPVIVRDRRAAIIGRISMDTLAIDLRNLPDCSIGEPILLWGDALPIELIACRAGTIPNQLLAGLTFRVPRRHISLRHL